MDAINLSVKEFKELKEKAEMDIAVAVTKIFEDFKSATSSYFTNQSIYIDMVYVSEIGHKKHEGIVNGASISMDIF
ncbi:MAG TPA: hypothetical protein VI911_07640 [Patescibacteria group bacterium]|nr:hypothetical protein [Patescibacteria group bacterium]